MDAWILALDIGTSAVKASLVSTELKIIAEAAQRYPTHYPQPHCVEQNAEDWWAAAVDATHKLMEKCPEAKARVSAIGVSGHMLGLLPVDAQGNAIAPSLIHTDMRAIAETETIARVVGHEQIYYRSGNVLNASASMCKALWVKENTPDVYARTAKFLQAKDYLNLRLTGNLNTTDLSDASHGMLIDIRSKRYLEEEFRDLGLDAAKFPELHVSTDEIGRLTPEAAAQLGLSAGIPVAAGGGDGACANVGAGIGKTGDAYCSLGTTGWIACNMDEPYLDEKMRVFNILSLDGKKSAVYGTVENVGRCIEWAQRLYVPEGIDEMNRLAAGVKPGSEGLIFLPYLTGERTPIFDPMARGVFFGIGADHDRRHFVRSVFEGVSFALSEVADILREKMPLEEIRVIGGGAKSMLWRQILADAGRLTLRGVDASSDAATSLGAAAAAGCAVGIFRGIEDAVERIAMTEATHPIAENVEIYAKRLALYRQLYPALKEAFHSNTF